MVDALASGASGRKAVEVRVLSWAPTTLNIAFLWKDWYRSIAASPTFIALLHKSSEGFIS